MQHFQCKIYGFCHKFRILIYSSCLNHVNTHLNHFCCEIALQNRFNCLCESLVKMLLLLSIVLKFGHISKAVDVLVMSYIVHSWSWRGKCAQPGNIDAPPSTPAKCLIPVYSVTLQNTHSIWWYNSSADLYTYFMYVRQAILPSLTAAKGDNSVDLETNVYGVQLVSLKEWSNKHKNYFIQQK